MPALAVMDGLEALNRALAGRYALENEIGFGGMAIVYRARDLSLDPSDARVRLAPAEP